MTVAGMVGIAAPRTMPMSLPMPVPTGTHPRFRPSSRVPRGALRHDWRHL